MGQSSKKNPDQTPPESPPEEVGSLLAELLQETRKEVVRERDTMVQKLEDRRSEERAAKEKSEARKREELQAQLLEETRRRNEALNRRDRETDAERKAEEMLLALEQAATPAAEVADLAQPESASPQASGSSLKLGLVVALVVGMGAGGWALTVNNQPKMDLPDISRRAEETVSRAVLQWKAAEAEKKAAAEKKAREEAQAKALEEERARLDAEKKAREEERARLEAEKAGMDPEAEKAAKPDQPRKKRPRRKKSLKLKKGLF